MPPFLREIPFWTFLPFQTYGVKAYKRYLGSTYPPNFGPVRLVTAIKMHVPSGLADMAHRHNRIILLDRRHDKSRASRHASKDGPNQHEHGSAMCIRAQMPRSWHASQTNNGIKIQRRLFFVWPCHDYVGKQGMGQAQQVR